MKKLLQTILCTTMLFILSITFINIGQASAKEFKDVPKKHPNYAAIQEMEKKGFISGYPDGKFRPNEPISRKHVASLLDKALKLPKASKKLIYKDVPLNLPYYQPIMNLTQAGIVSGGLNQKFNPNAPITRIQMAKILDLAFRFRLDEWTGGFHDMYMDHWGFVHANALLANGVAYGNNGKFHPNRPVTRAHYAEFLSRALEVGVTPVESGTVSREQVLDLLNRMPAEVEGVMIRGFLADKKFSEIRSQLLPYATARFTDIQMKPDYKYVCFECDTSFFPYYISELSVRLNYSQSSKDTLIVNTILLDSDGPVSGGVFVDYIFKKETEKWKIHDMTYTRIGKRNFELTQDEVKQILIRNYSYYKPVYIQFISQSEARSRDEKSGEMYTYNKYRFDVQSSYGRSTVEVRSDNGYYERY
ncbi:S-layer homology domain-containing protein [Sporosarcina ureae]|uniref:S-layer homology domain-containing protein n=1 Tax=Sporosarcina ureae TaxID=1571 RepID=UPI0026EEEB2B|nr:S-layer homology domain-containing protein [Sporosarcina ureae]